MDAAVLEETLQRDPGDLPAYAVEAREQDRAGRVVDDEVDSRERLEAPDVAPLSADDAALQLVRLEFHDGHGGLDGVAARHPLHDGREDAPRPPLGVLLGLVFYLANELGALVADLVLELAQQDLLGLTRAEAREALQLAQLLALRLLEGGAVLLEVALSVVEGSLGELGAAGAQLLLDALNVGNSSRARFLSLRGSGLGRPARSDGARLHGPRTLHHEDHRHRDGCRHQRRQHDLHLVSSVRRARAGRSSSSGAAGAARHKTLLGAERVPTAERAWLPLRAAFDPPSGSLRSWLSGLSSHALREPMPPICQ